MNPETHSSRETLTVALISDVFFDNNPEARLRSRLEEAKQQGAELAVLPELPLNSWSPATKQARDDDAEAPEGPRWRMQSEAAKAIGISLVGGVIVRDPDTGRRHNTALVFDDQGQLVGSFQKIHIPEEPGFWETSHYGAGDTPSPVFDHLGFPFGVQICSDINRPEGSHLLGAMGAKLVVAPRSTELATYERWRVVFQANALTSCLYVLSVNRPVPEQDVLIGGPSIAVAPNGRILLETTDPVGVVTIDAATIRQAKIDYPGYLPVRADVYAKAWSAVAQGC